MVVKLIAKQSSYHSPTKLKHKVCFLVIKSHATTHANKKSLARNWHSKPKFFTVKSIIDR
jgi:hypothetical protein